MTPTADGAVMLEAQKVGIVRGSRRILQDLSFSIGDGEFLCIVGPNGAGKTTLLRCLLGSLRSTEGQVLLKARPIERYSRREVARLLSYVPQADARRVSFSVEEFVMLGRYPHWSRFSTISAKDRDVLREAVELTGVSAFFDRSVSSLSGGERQKVFIAAAIAQDASVVLLDEPTTFLDPRHQAGTCDLLCRLNAERGLTVVMVTHDINLAARYGQRVLALQDGAAAYWGSAAGFLDADRLEILYGIPFEIMRGEFGRTWAVSRTSP